MSTKPVYLEVDSSITEKQLKVVSNETEEKFEKYLSGKEAEYPSKYIVPTPGLCVKSKDDTGKKIFINLCHSELIPEPPNDFTNLNIEEILGNDVSEYRVPMSIGDLHPVDNAKGEECSACDVVINTLFFKKINYKDDWKNFVLTIIFEAISEKYKVDCLKQDKIILKNKKQMGSLQRHRIQDREMAKKMGVSELPNPLVQNKPIIETLSTTKFEPRCPEYCLFKRKEKLSCLIGEFKFPDVISANELKLDVGEDRIVIECEQRNYLLDIFIPVMVRCESTSSVFDKATKILTVNMPLIGG